MAGTGRDDPAEALIDYDPDRTPDPAAWLDLDEDARTHAVQAWCRRQGVELSNERVYAAMLATVETQVAMGDELPVAETVERLRREGFSRREAVHAVSTVLAETMYDAFYGEEPGADPQGAYFDELRRLTPESWRARFDDEPIFPLM
ncbi:MAG: hypothetical protein ACLF0P_00485 [Thermoanaerobaculia bacterium]